MPSEEKSSLYSQLAHQAAAHYIKFGDYLPLEDNLAPQLKRQQACFVSALEMPGRRSRGMAGNALPTQPTLAHEIVVQTVGTVRQNSGRPITRLDLPHIHFTVALLGTLQRIRDINHLNPEQFGLYVTSDRGKTSLVLPERAGVYTADDQMATALREAHIDTRHESYSMYRFSVEHYDG